MPIVGRVLLETPRWIHHNWSRYCYHGLIIIICIVVYPWLYIKLMDLLLLLLWPILLGRRCLWWDLVLASWLIVLPWLLWLRLVLPWLVWSLLVSGGGYIVPCALLVRYIVVVASLSHECFSIQNKICEITTCKE